MPAGDDKVLERFMKEFFPFNEFKKIGFFTKEMKGDYEAQAKKVCYFLGYDTVYEYRSKEIRCHLSYSSSHQSMSVNAAGKLEQEPFVTVIPSIYE